MTPGEREGSWPNLAVSLFDCNEMGHPQVSKRPAGVRGISRASQSTLRHKEAELIPCALIDEEHGQMVWCIFFFNDVWRHNPPLAILQVLPLIRAILANPEAGFEYIAVVTARFPWNAEAQLCGRAHDLLVVPFVVRHRGIVSVSTKGQEKQNTECRQYAIERFHGSLRYGLSFILASANHTNSPASNEATF